MFKLINRLKNKKGFTLIELIVVLAVLGIIALIAIPRFLTVQEGAREDADYGTAAGIAKAAELYFVQEGLGTADTTILYSDMKNANYIDSWTGWQYFTNDGATSSDATANDDVTITVNTAGAGTVLVEDSAGADLYPKP